MLVSSIRSKELVDNCYANCFHSKSHLYRKHVLRASLVCDLDRAWVEGSEDGGAGGGVGGATPYTLLLRSLVHRGQKDTNHCFNQGPLKWHINRRLNTIRSSFTTSKWHHRLWVLCPVNMSLCPIFKKLAAGVWQGTNSSLSKST